MTNAPLIGIVTGFVSALLFVSVSSGTLFGVLILFFLAPMPIAIAGLGWGATAGFTAAITGTLLIVLVGGVLATAVFYLLAIALPMASSSYLLMLSRQYALPAPSTTVVVEWYPIGRLLALAAGWAAFLAALALIATGQDLASLRATLQDVFATMIAEGGPLAKTFKQPLTDKEKADFINILVATLPGGLASLWFTVALINLWLAGHATRISGRLLRPWPDLSTIMLPQQLPFVFAAAILATFLGGMFGLFASGLAFAIMLTYVLAGLAIIHWTTRGLASRPAILMATYMSLAVLNPFSTIFVALIGIAEPISPLRRQPDPATPETEDT